MKRGSQSSAADAPERSRSPERTSSTSPANSAQIRQLVRLLFAIARRGRKCSLKVYFDGKNFRWDYTSSNITADDLKG